MESTSYSFNNLNYVHIKSISAFRFAKSSILNWTSNNIIVSLIERFNNQIKKYFTDHPIIQATPLRGQ